MAFNLQPPPPSGRAPSDRRRRSGGAEPQAPPLGSLSPSTARRLQNELPEQGDYVLYTALYDYRSDDPDDLEFDAGDILQVTDEGDGPESWLTGRSQDGREGTFPGTFVRKVRVNTQKRVFVNSEGGVEDPPVAQPSHPAPPPPSNPPSAALQEQMHSQQQQVASDSAPQPPPAATPSADTPYVLYQTLYQYKSDDPEDLEFEPNEIIRVTDEGDGPDSWFYGESQDGRQGSFPGNFVRKIRMQASGPRKIEGLDHT